MHTINPFNPAIDLNQLDKEWLGQAELFYQWSRYLADCRAFTETKRREVDLTKAEVFLDVVQNPTRYGFTAEVDPKKPNEIKPIKPTVDAINAAVESSQEYQIANKELIAARHTQDVAVAVVDSLDHRKRALENLVRLHLAGYFATPQSNSGESIAARNRREAAYTD